MYGKRLNPVGVEHFSETAAEEPVVDDQGLVLWPQQRTHKGFHGQVSRAYQGEDTRVLHIEKVLQQPLRLCVGLHPFLAVVRSCGLREFLGGPRLQGHWPRDEEPHRLHETWQKISPPLLQVSASCRVLRTRRADESRCTGDPPPSCPRGRPRPRGRPG